ncbi:mitochondrial carrier domain-containing protein [Kalaharituber pfeilii]|nr:mitochondrial carrier domain-containing protein [Kalaharituber pfeilii]
MTATEVVKESLIGASRAPLLSTQARRTFERFASIEIDGQKYMSENDFVNAIAPPGEDYHKIRRGHYSILFAVADRKKTGKLSLQDWATFENLLTKPDAEYEIVFRLFDTQGTGSVKFEDFTRLHDENRANGLPFDWNCQWANLYLGGAGKRHDLTYEQFTQMVRGLQGEKIRQAFKHYDKNRTGYIEAEEFQKIVEETAKHKLSDHLLNNLFTLCNISAGTKISYANVRAFQNVIRELDMVEAIVRSATAKTPDGKITKIDFLNEATKLTRFSLFTPMEADIIFHFAGLDNTSGRLGLLDFARVLDPSWVEPTINPSGAISGLPLPGEGEGAFFTQVGQSLYNFALGSVAGAFGATIVYPIDLVKTRMQNQRSKVVGELMYKNSIDCAKKVVKNEGFRGLYSGLGPQLIGVAPEKAIKLTVNDLVRSKAPKDKMGEISLPWELIAGGTAGGCQVIFTNPLEIVKIRLQVQGEVARNVEGVQRRSALWIVRNLGLVGLYKGASACLMRDVPFSAIYFPTYSHLKKDFFGESADRKLGILQLLAAGAAAGMPAAYFTTPFDVIKTRLQVEARKGQTMYRGLIHCAQTVWKEEGFKAFFKGGPARIMRSSPQFGCTLAAYELLQSLIPMPGGGKKETGVTEAVRQRAGLKFGEQDKPLGYLRSRNALKIILDLNENFAKPTYLKKESGWGGLSSLKQA